MSDTQDVVAPQSQPDIGQYIAKAVQLRDLIKEKDDEHKKAMQPYREAFDAIKVYLLGELQRLGTDKIANKTSGTISKLEKTSASVVDREALLEYVIANGEWGMLDFSANKDSVRTFIKNNGGALPPGVKWTSFFDLGLRRPTSTGEAE